jgi:WD40 repeat protein
MRFIAMLLCFFPLWRRLSLVVLVWAICSLWQPDVWCQTSSQPPTQPVLRIETGMHTARIRRIGVDVAGRFLVTGSDDKTVRVWELATGRLLRVLRPPLGAGNEGKIGAVALSPDGRTIAAGGWTGYEWDKQNSIYLFDRASGRMVRRLGGLPNVVFHLAFSPDGARLAAALGRGEGIRVFGVADGAEVGRDTGYGDASYGLDFDRAGRLVTSCDDGYLRLYDRSLKLLKRVRAPGGKEPLAVRFAPDGTQVAVGYYDTTRVDVLDGGTLAPLYQPDTSGVSNGDLGRVAWSADGAALYAGGRWNDGTRCPIRRWAEAGRGRPQDLAAASSTIMDLAPLPAGGVVFGAGDPAWGVFSVRGERTRLVAGQIADYRNNREGFRTDAAGGAVGFAYELFGKAPAWVSLPERRLATEAGGALQAPRTDGLAITDWEDNDAPKLNGAKLALEPYEIARSLAIAPDAQRFLLGTEWALRLFDRSGKQQWQAAGPSAAWSVNISGNGKLALAAFSDGTIRWYRLTDGEELLAFFPHKDRKRWVLWTPSGYYDAAPGAEELIGWHVNNGKDAAADFFPVGQFRKDFYRPDVIDLILQTLDESKAVEQANLAANRRREEDLLRRLPPIVEIVAPASGVRVTTPVLKLRYQIRSPSGLEITAVKILIDGRPETGKGQGRRPPQPGLTGEADVTLPERDCEVSVIAETSYTTSQPASVRVVWAGGVASFLKPSLYLLAVGVNEDREPETERLQYAGKDAEDFAAAMKAQEGGLYGKVVTRVLAGPGATKDRILDGFDWLVKETTARDVAMVLLSGHGLPDHGRYFFMTSSAERGRLLATAVSFAEIKGLVEVIPGKVVFFLDTCHSGNALGTAKGPFDLNRVINELASADNGAVVFASSTGRQRSFENTEWKNGAFTKAVVEGINGRADLFNHGKISVETLGAWIAKRVKELTNNEQSPVVLKPGSVPDFPVAVRR